MATVLEAPARIPAPEGGWRRTIFLGGGITGCWDWQQALIAKLDLPDDVLLCNPRRAEFPADPTLHDAFAVSEEQVIWEHNHLMAADLILFYFTGDRSPQPIVLYELGRYAALGYPLIVTVEPGYPRAVDVELQLRMARPGTPIHQSMDETVAAITRYTLA